MGEASKGNGRGKEGMLAAKLSAARSYRLSVSTGGDGTSSEALSPMLQHLRDITVSSPVMTGQ